MRIFEVRCCCQPQQILGYLPVPDSAKTSVTYALSHQLGGWPEQIRFDLAEIVESYMNEYGDTVHDRHLAIKAEGITLETLKRIGSFSEFYITAERKTPDASPEGSPRSAHLR